MRRNRRLLLAAFPAAMLAAFIAFIFFRAQRTLTSATQHAAAAHHLAFTLQPYNPAVHAAANPVFTPVAAHIAYTAGTLFTNLAGTQELYLAGPDGLTVQAADGTRHRTLRTGYDLPVAPITAIAQGRPRGATEPQVLIATAGAGLLFITPTSLHQLLPKEAALADLTALLPLASGDLLLGTRHRGVLLFNGTTLTQLPLALSSSNTLEVTALAAPDSTSLLIGTRSAGVLYGHAGTIAQATQASGLPDDQVLAMATAPGMAYIGTPLGVAAIPLSDPSFRPIQTLAQGSFANTLAITPNALQIGTLDAGVLTLPLTSQPRLHNVAITAPGSSSPASAQRVDAFLTPTLALADGALLARTTSGWHPAFSPVPAQTLTDRNIAALAFDPEGRLYVGFFDHGLDILHPDGTLQQHLEDDHLFCINRLALDPRRHTIAAATADGLVLFDATGIPRQTLTRRDGLLSNHVTDIAFTPTGMALATPAGITFIAPTGTASLYAFEGLVNNHVYTLATGPTATSGPNPGSDSGPNPGSNPGSNSDQVSGRDQLLAGTLGGLSVLTAQVVTRNLTTSNSALAHNWVTALALLPTGDYLAGTYGAGLQRIGGIGTGTGVRTGPGTPVFTAQDLPAGTPSNLVINPNALLVTPTHLYAGTLGQGLLVYSNRTARWTRITTGLPSLNVTAFAANAGRLFVGTENGLVSIPEASL